MAIDDKGALLPPADGLHTALTFGIMRLDNPLADQVRHLADLDHRDQGIVVLLIRSRPRMSVMSIRFSACSSAAIRAAAVSALML